MVFNLALYDTACIEQVQWVTGYDANKKLLFSLSSPVYNATYPHCWTDTATGLTAGKLLPASSLIISHQLLP